MPLDLEHSVPQDLANSASLDDLMKAVSAVEEWTPRQATVLDYVYRHRIASLLSGSHDEDDLLALAEHLHRVTHPRRQEALDSLDRAYAERWKGYEQLLESRLRVVRAREPQRVLERAHVKEILEAVAAEEGIGQADLARRMDLGAVNASRILSLMEANDLIYRRKMGREKRVFLGSEGKAYVDVERREAGAEPVEEAHREVGLGWASKFSRQYAGRDVVAHSATS